MTDQVAEAFAALDRVDVPLSWDDITRRASNEPELPAVADPPVARSSFRRLAVVGIAAAVLVIAIVAVSLRLESGDDSPGMTLRGGTTPRVTNAGPTTTPTTQPPATSSFRVFPVTAWTGAQYLVWSGEDGSTQIARGDGWAYDPATGTTTALPAAPIGPRTEAVGVWTGSELIVCCGAGTPDNDGTRTAAAYRPDTGEWRTLADPPEFSNRGFGAAVWTGDEMIVIFGGNGDGAPAAIAYNPVNDQWRRLAAPPESLARRPQAAWTGREVIVWSQVYGDVNHADVGYSYDPAFDQWTALPKLPDDRALTAGSMVWTGDEIIVYGQSALDEWRAAGGRLLPGDDVWRPLPDPGLRRIEWYEGTPGSQTLVWDGPSHRLVVWPVHGNEYGAAGPPLLSFDPDVATWAQLGSPKLGYEPNLRVGAGVVLQPDRERPVVARVTQ